MVYVVNGSLIGEQRLTPARHMAVVIVTYNSAADIGRCIDTVAKQAPAEIVVVDNNSSDDSADIARNHGAKVLEQRENSGFAAAVNAGVEQTSAPILFVVNPDCVVMPGALAGLQDLLEGNPQLGVVGPRIENPDGTLQPSCRKFPDLATSVAHGFVGLVWRDNPLSVRYTMRDWDHSTPRSVDWVSGAAMAMRRDAFDAVDGFDPGYFMYVEDVDFCWRVRQQGFDIQYEPSVTVRHAIGGSSSKRPYRLLIEHHRSMLRFEKRRRGGDTSAVWPLLWAGVWTRAGVAIAKRWLTGASESVKIGRSA